MIFFSKELVILTIITIIKHWMIIFKINLKAATVSNILTTIILIFILNRCYYAFMTLNSILI